MKVGYTQSRSSALTASQANVSDLGEQHDVTAADIGLTCSSIQALYAASPTRQAAALTKELYRLRGLLRRTAQFLELARARGMEQSLDITSKTLLLGLSEALKREPAINQQLTREYSSMPQTATLRREAF